MAGVGIGLAASHVSGVSLGASVLGFMVGLALMLPGHVLGATGAGDVKFMAMCGLLLGPWESALAIMVAMVGGSVLGLIIWAVRRNREIPFGPFLAMGVLAVLFYGPDIERLILVTYPNWVRGG